MKTPGARFFRSSANENILQLTAYSTHEHSPFFIDFSLGKVEIYPI